MNDYVKPSVRSSPGNFNLHVGTNDLSSNKSSEEIARSITDVKTSIKNEKHDVSISNIIILKTSKKLEERGVNIFLGNCARRRTIILFTIPRKSKETI